MERAFVRGKFNQVLCHAPQSDLEWCLWLRAAHGTGKDSYSTYKGPLTADILHTLVDLMLQDGQLKQAQELIENWLVQDTDDRIVFQYCTRILSRDSKAHALEFAELHSQPMLEQVSRYMESILQEPSKPVVVSEQAPVPVAQPLKREPEHRVIPVIRKPTTASTKPIWLKGVPWLVLLLLGMALRSRTWTSKLYKFLRMAMTLQL